MATNGTESTYYLILPTHMLYCIYKIYKGMNKKHKPQEKEKSKLNTTFTIKPM